MPEPESPDRKRSDGNRTLLIVLAGIGSLGLIALLVCAGVAFYMARDVGQQLGKAFPALQPLAPVAVEEESLAERQAALKDAFEGADADAGAGRHTVAAIERELERIRQVSGDEHAAQFRKVVDVERFFLQMRKTGLVSVSNGIEQQAYIRAYRDEALPYPLEWDRHVIAQVKRLADPHEYVVTACVWADDSPMVARFWFRETNLRWSLYDWEFVDFGVRESYEMAVYLKESTNPVRAQHFQAHQDENDAENLEAQGKTEAAIVKMRQAASRPALPQLADQQLIRQAYGWRRLGRNREAAESSRRVKEPGRFAAALEVQIECLHAIGRERASLPLADQYLAAVGGGPQAWEFRSDALAALGRHAEANEVRLRMLRFEPDDRETLIALAENLTEGQTSDFEACVLKTKAPLETALGVAERLWSPRSVAGLRALGGLVARLQPGSAAVDFLRGTERMRDGDYDEAATAFRQAFEKETDDDRKKSAVDRYLDAMQSAGRMLEGYEQAPDPKAAFAYLTNDFEIGEGDLPPAELRALVAAHRLRMPDDPRLHGAEGKVLEESGQYEAAAREFALAEKAEAKSSAPDEDDDGNRSLWRSLRINALHKAGKDLEAYAEIPPADETFRALVQQFRYAPRLEPLPELIEAHRRAMPDDPWLAFAEVSVEQRRGRPAEALRLAQEAIRRLPAENNVRSALIWNLQDLCLETGEFAPILENAGSAEHMVEGLFMRLLSEERLDVLQKAIEARRNDRATANDWRRWQVELLAARHDDAGVVRELTPWPPPFADTMNSWSRSALAEKLFRSLLHLGRISGAESLAAELDLDGQGMPRLIVLARERKVDELLRLVAEDDSRATEVANLFSDADVGPIVRGPEFIRLREACPPELPNLTPVHPVTLFFGTPPVLTDALIAEAAEAALGKPIAVESLALPGNQAGDEAANGIKAWLVRAGEALLAISAASKPYLSASARSQLGPLDEPDRRLLHEHRGWVTISLLQANLGQQVRPERIKSYRLASHLVTEECLGGYLTGSLLTDKSKLRDRLDSDTPADRSRIATGGHLFLPNPVDDEVTGSAREAEDRVFRRTFKRFTDRFERRQPGETFEVVVDSNVGEGRERLALEVKRIVDRHGFGMATIHGTLKAGSRWLPDATVGSVWSVSSYRLDDWSISEGEKSERGRPQKLTDK